MRATAATFGYGIAYIYKALICRRLTGDISDELAERSRRAYCKAKSRKELAAV